MTHHYHGFFRRQKTRLNRRCATIEARDEKILVTRLPRCQRAAPRTRTNDQRAPSPTARNRVKENLHKTKAAAGGGGGRKPPPKSPKGASPPSARRARAGVRTAAGVSSRGPAPRAHAE